ncbi:PREDICTED: protein maelstrom homolog, partial [Chlamydotis macqueenii]|uniref:protein maelstrom homolog n=1 Tax=Chlamydotis macqueenii TaxID=187382 RepID=UPI000529D9FE
LLTKEEKMVYAEKARKWNEKRCSRKMVKETCNLAHPIPACLTTKMPSVTSIPDASAMSWKNDQAVVADIFYFLNIYSHGKLPSHCEQRFLPCEIGCVKYSLQDGIIADFHHFIDPEVPPRGFRYHCQAASDATHKIPISGFHLSRTCYAVVLRELLEFVQPARGVRPRFYCRSNDRFQISWCLNRMACLTGIESHLELLAVEDLVIRLYQKKYQKEPSKTWVCRELDVFLWDFSSNTRCKWHEENDILCCALASCKKTAYCISKSLASVYGVSLTAAHLPLQDSDYSESTHTKMVVLDVGRFQKMKVEGSGCDRHLASPSQDQEFVPSNCDSPCGVKTSLYGTSTMRGRGITRLLKSAPDLFKSLSN